MIRNIRSSLFYVFTAVSTLFLVAPSMAQNTDLSSLTGELFYFETFGPLNNCHFESNAFVDNPSPDPSPYQSGSLLDGKANITLGGRDNANIRDMSAGWRCEFALFEASTVAVVVDFILQTSERYDPGEISQVLVKIDDQILEPLAEIEAGGSIVRTKVIVESKVLEAGSHTIVVGAKNNLKTWNDEITFAEFYDFGIVKTNRVLLDEDFGSDTICEFEIDAFAGDEPTNNRGSVLSSIHNDEESALLIFGLGGKRSADNTTAGYRCPIEQGFPAKLIITSDFTLEATEAHEFGEISEILVKFAVDDVEDIFAPLAMVNGGGRVEGESVSLTTDFVFLGGENFITIGAKNNKMTYKDEITTAEFFGLHVLGSVSEPRSPEFPLSLLFQDD